MHSRTIIYHERDSKRAEQSQLDHEWGEFEIKWKKYDYTRGFNLDCRTVDPRILPF